MASASFPTSLTEIGMRAFFMYNQGGITSLNIPSSVTTLGEKAFVHFMSIIWYKAGNKRYVM